MLGRWRTLVRYSISNFTMRGSSGVLRPPKGVRRSESAGTANSTVTRCRRSAGFLPAALDIHQRENRAVDLVVGCAIGANAEQIVAALFVAHFTLAYAECVDHFAQKF